MMHSFCVIENHTKEVNCCAFSKKFFVTCSGDKTIRVYSAVTFQELPYSPIKTFKYGLNFVAFDNSETYLASACSDGKAHLFQLSENEAKSFAVFRHSDTNTAQVCAFSNNSLYLVTGSADGSIALWDINSKKLIKEISGHPEGNVYAAAFTPCDHYLITGSGLGDIRVWDILTMQATMQTQAHDEGISSCGVTCIKFSPTFHSTTALSGMTLSGTLVAADDPDRCFLMASCGQDNKIKLWIFSNRSRALQSFQELPGHHGPVSFCCFSPDGKNLASSSFDKTIIIWDTVTREQQLVLDGHNTIVTCVAYSADNYLASTSYDKKVIIWKMDQNEDGHPDFTSDQPINKVSVNRIEDMTAGVVKLSLDDLSPEETLVTFEKWSCDLVVSWLTDQVKLGQYSINFRENAIDGAELSSLTSEVLQRDLGVAPLGHRNKILRAVKVLQDAKEGQRVVKSDLSPPEGAQGQGWQKIVKTSVKITDKRPAMIDRNIPDQYLCPISRDLMTDPVLAADGFTYERSMIESWFSKGNKLSPMTHKVILSKSLIPNQALKSLIIQFQEDRNEKSEEWKESQDAVVIG